MRICCASSGFSSMLIFTMRTAPRASFTAFSSAGPSVLHGPHQGAQKSTMTGVSIDASMDTPVIVDFWAPWCGPCKTLGPALEKAVKEARGAVRMVKINIDENPELAQQMRIQSIPAVYAFSQGR